MKILSVNHLLDPVSGGGTAERTLQLARAFAQSGARCSILTLDIGLDAPQRERLRDIEVIALPCIWRRFFVPRVSWRQLRQQVAAADVVHIVGHWTLLNALVYLAARATGRPHVICPAGALPITGRSGFLKRAYNRIIGRAIVRQAAGHVAITRDEIAQFEQYGVDGSAVTVIPNGIAPEDYTGADCEGFLDRHALRRRRFVLFLGRIAHIKGPDLLLDAYATLADRFPEVDLVYAGPDDGMLAALRARVSEHNLDARVRFIGYVQGNDKACALRSCELLAIPSRQEAMSIVALEAAACGRPVLLTDQCGFNEIGTIRGGRIAGATVDEIAQALGGMLGDRGELAAMGTRLNAFVRQHYTWEQAAAGYLALFRSVTGGT